MNGRQLLITIGIAFACLCMGVFFGSTFSTETNPAPKPTVTVTSTPRPVPGPTTTITQSVPADNSSCLRVGDLARDMAKEIGTLSEGYGIATNKINAAIRALGAKDTVRLNKILGEIQANSETSDAPMQRLVTLNQQLDIAYKECEKS